MADYRENYDKIRAAGADVVAVSVDPPDKSESVRRQLDLPFPILCDTGRRLVQDWDLYNPREKGGIAKPAVFIIDRDRTLCYASVDATTVRVSAADIVRILHAAEPSPADRKLYLPRPTDFFRALRNTLRRAPTR